MPLNHTTRGRVIAVKGSVVVFKPTHSTYELHLTTAAGYDGRLDVPLDAVLRAVARKVYTVPSGGGFITPIMGTPKIIQGRVIDLAGSDLAVKSAVTLNIVLPTAANAIELAQGPIETGVLLNAVLLAGASFEIAPVTAATPA